jgi:hypothetical protein
VRLISAVAAGAHADLALAIESARIPGNLRRGRHPNDNPVLCSGQSGHRWNSQQAPRHVSAGNFRGLRMIRGAMRVLNGRISRPAPGAHSARMTLWRAGTRRARNAARPAEEIVDTAEPRRAASYEQVAPTQKGRDRCRSSSRSGSSAPTDKTRQEEDGGQLPDTAYLELTPAPVADSAAESVPGPDRARRRDRPQQHRHGPGIPS